MEGFLFGGLSHLLLGYLIGSIPFAWLIVRAFSKQDLRKEGSGNIGTLNSYEVSGSKIVGIMVLIADIAKGTVPMVLLLNLAPELVSMVAVGLIIGHCYPVWLKFHGGRGLATGAGALFVLQPLFPITWLILYFLFHKLTGNLHIGAVLALLLDVALVFIIPFAIWGPIGAALFLERPDLIRMTISAMSLVILLRHIEPIMTLRKTGAPTDLSRKEDLSPASLD